MCNIDIYVNNDTFVSKSSNHENFSKCPYLLLGRVVCQNTVKDINIIFLHFDLWAIDERVTMDKAELYLYANNYDTLNSEENEFQMEMYKLLSEYNGTTVTWNKVPKVCSSGYKTKFILKKTKGIIKIDVTNIVREWIENPGSNFGLILISKSANGIISFKSSRCGNGPKLRLKYRNNYEEIPIASLITDNDSEEISYYTNVPQKHDTDNSQIKILKTIENNINNIARFAYLNENKIYITNKESIPLSNDFIIGEDITHLDGSPNISLASNHIYLISWNITTVQNKGRFIVEVCLYVNGFPHIGGESIVSFSSKNNEIVTLSASTILKTNNERAIIQLRYSNNLEKTDIINSLEVSVIEIK